MSPQLPKPSPESSSAGLYFNDTELTLGLPGATKSGTKRGFSDTVGLNLRGPCNTDHASNPSENDVSGDSKPPPAKTQIVGWPPVKASRKNVAKISKYVKVAVDGAPYLRKVDLEMYGSYQQLLGSLEDMFSCFPIRNYLNERKLMDPVKGSDYMPTYEDRDGDWMLVGDVPWKMFVESCKRLRLMKSIEAIGLGKEVFFFFFSSFFFNIKLYFTDFFFFFLLKFCGAAPRESQKCTSTSGSKSL
ncbi:auxin-responsive protein IAA1 isoform X1 [Vitis vinifera]|uniref:auxin-responsive protein IAA1 isoform X1 n=1 Tax=Vitis vinifera TaxID=29760 RepID=UPI00015C8E97|nr:auxin-responsive protein IAA1 isoform X1 [Vitis vinifera]